jgi:hypothetical protein
MVLRVFMLFGWKQWYSGLRVVMLFGCKEWYSGFLCCSTLPLPDEYLYKKQWLARYGRDRSISSYNSIVLLRVIRINMARVVGESVETSR